MRTYVHVHVSVIVTGVCTHCPVGVAWCGCVHVCILCVPDVCNMCACIYIHIHIYMCMCIISLCLYVHLHFKHSFISTLYCFFCLLFY